MGETQTVALVSHHLPPGRDGYSLILDELFAAVPEPSLALVGLRPLPWGGRARASLPVPRIPGRESESVVMAAVMSATRALAPPVLRRLFPNVRRIVTTLDPAMIVADQWARATGADLWIYGIDLHASAFWRAGDFLKGALGRWRRQAYSRASRVFGLSPRMNEWLRADGAPGEVELLPPLINVDRQQPASMPVGKRSLLFAGWLYAAQGRALSWVERAVKDLAPSIELRLLSQMKASAVAAAGLDPARWTLRGVTPEGVPAEVAAATGVIVALDPTASDRVPLQVAWPSKLREYLSVGRPVLCIAPPDYGLVDLAREGGWGLVAHDETSTRAAVAAFAAASDAELQARGAAAHQFALRHMNNRTAGAAFRRALLGP